MYVKSIDREAHTLIDCNGTDWKYYYSPEELAEALLNAVKTNPDFSDVSVVDTWTQEPSITLYNYGIVSCQHNGSPAYLLIRQTTSGESTYIDYMLSITSTDAPTRSLSRHLLDIVAHQ